MIDSWFSKYITLRATLFFGILGVILFLIQFSTPALTDPDGYYHIKASQIISKEGFSRLVQFSSFTASIWGQYQADLSLGFHLILIPFLLVFAPIFAIKFLAVVSGMILAVTFFWCLRILSVQHPFWWTALLFLCSSIFLYRVTLPRGFVLSISLLLLSYALFATRSYRTLFFVVFAYTWIHPSAMLVLALGALFFLTRLFLERQRDWQSLVVPLAGYFGGIILRPDAFDYFPLLLLQNFASPIERWSGITLDWATELRPVSLFALGSGSFIALILFLMGVSLLLWRWRNGLLRSRAHHQEKTALVVALITTTIFFVGALHTYRLIDYWVPFALLFAALVTKDWFDHHQIKNIFHQWYGRNSKVVLIIGAIILLILSGNVVRAVRGVQSAEPLEKFQEASLWLKHNTPEGSIVFHTDWDDFPKLFYNNDHNRYLVGLDPTFMYVYDPKLYWLWRNISDLGVAIDRPLNKEEKDNYLKIQDPSRVQNVIRDQFHSEIIFVPKERTELQNMLEKNPERFTKKEEDEWAKIYFVNP